MEFSFSASGWLFLYQMGVAKMLQMTNAVAIDSDVRLTGASGGSLVSTVLMVDADVDKLRDYILECVEKCRNHHQNAFKLKEYVTGAFEMAKEDIGDFYQVKGVQEGRLGVSVTTVPNMKNHIITSFSSQRELEEAVLASCTMTPLAGFPFQLNRETEDELHKQWVLDGGLSNIQPHFLDNGAKNLIKIAAFHSWDADIKPSLHIPYLWGLYPASKENMSALFDLGKYDALQFISANVDRFPGVNLEGIDLSKPTSIDRLARSTESPHAISDKAVAITYKTLFKGMAFVSVYAEQSYLAGYNLTKGLLVGLEKNRRKIKEPSKSILSIRRWLPFVGSASGNVQNGVANVKNLLSVKEIWADIDERKQEFVKNSYFMKYFG